MLLISVAVFVVHLALKYVSVAVFNEKHGFLFELSNRFDMNDESSVPQWFTLMGFLAISAGSFLAARMAGTARLRRLWKIIAILALLLSVDDAAALHEYILQSLHNTFFLDTAPTFMRNTWLILMPIVLLIGGWLLVQCIKLLPRRTTVSICTGALIFLFGAVLVDSFANNYPERAFITQGVISGIEGGLQLIGLSVMIYGIWEYLQSKHGQAINEAVKRLKPN